MIRTTSPFPVFLLAVLAAGLDAQEWYTDQLATAPPARRFHALAHVGGTQLLFGGVDEATGTVHGDTWTYDGLAWTQLAIAGPGPRQRFAACVDRTRDVLVVFGGADANGNPLGDTWEFDGATWQQVLPLVSPSPRLGAAMAFEPGSGRIVLFGGGATAGAPGAETWQYDGNTWSRALPATSPSARQGHAMTTDTANGVVLLFGGFPVGATGFVADTWQWTGADWQQVVTATTPTTSIFPAMTFFEAHGVAVLTGATGIASQPLATWVFDGLDWSVGPPAAPGMVGRQGHAATYDPLREMVVLFGGARITFGGALPLADTWELSIRAAFEPFGAGCTALAGTPQLTARAGDRPQLGSDFELEVEPAGSLALFVAGFSDSSFLGAPLPMDLGAFGLPGCSLLTSVDWEVWAPAVAGKATTAITVPLQRALLGLELFAQALVLDRTAAIPAAMSNGGRITIGN